MNKLTTRDDEAEENSPCAACLRPSTGVRATTPFAATEDATRGSPCRRCDGTARRPRGIKRQEDFGRPRPADCDLREFPSNRNKTQACVQIKSAGKERWQRGRMRRADQPGSLSFSPFLERLDLSPGFHEPGTTSVALKLPSRRSRLFSATSPGVLLYNKSHHRDYRCSIPFHLKCYYPN